MNFYNVSINSHRSHVINIELTFQFSNEIINQIF